MHWIVLSILLSFSPPSSDNVSSSKPLLCNHDSVCGNGDCWRGFCESGTCQAYWTCV
jgi:hypothetical protein